MKSLPRPWRVLVCPASFKGSLLAGAAGEAIRRGLVRIWPGRVAILFEPGGGGAGSGVPPCA